MKGNLLNGRKYLWTVYLIRGKYSKYRNNSYNSIAEKQAIWLQMIWIDIFSKEDIQIACSKYRKTCSTSLITREMKIKTTVRYHFTHVRKTIINKTCNTKSWWECGKKETLVHAQWECKLVHPLWKTEVPQKIKNRITIWSSSSSTLHLPEENKNTHLKKDMHPHVHSNIVYNSQNMESV